MESEEFFKLQKQKSKVLKGLKTPTILLKSLGPQAPFSIEQVLGVEFLYRLRRGILGDEVGLGKTGVAASLMRYIVERGEGNRFLVMCTASTILQWADEIVRYAPGIQIVIIQAGKKRKYKYNEIDSWGHHPVVVLVSYDIFTADVDKMLTYPWDLIGCDESSALKNDSTKRFKAVRRIGHVPGWMVMITATPLENSVMDLFNNAEILYPGYLGTKEVFENRYVATVEIPLRVNANYYRTIKKVAGFKKLDELRERTEWMILRRKPEDVGIKYPALIHRRVFLDMLPLQAKVYQDIRDGILQTSKRVKRVKMLARFKYLFSCVDGSLAQYMGLSPKVKATLEMVKAFTSAGNKVVIFSHSKRIVNFIQPLIEAEGINVLRITGDENVVVRERGKNLFNSDHEYKVMMITTAGSRGINLQGAYNMIMYNNTWNYALNKQVWGRVLRRTQKEPVCFVYELYIKNSIEESLIKTLERKKDLFLRVIEGDKDQVDTMGKEMSLDNLLMALRTDGQ